MNGKSRTPPHFPSQSLQWTSPDDTAFEEPSQFSIPGGIEFGRLDFFGAALTLGARGMHWTVPISWSTCMHWLALSITA